MFNDLEDMVSEAIDGDTNTEEVSERLKTPEGRAKAKQEVIDIIRSKTSDELKRAVLLSIEDRIKKHEIENRALAEVIAEEILFEFISIQFYIIDKRYILDVNLGSFKSINWTVITPIINTYLKNAGLVITDHKSTVSEEKFKVNRTTTETFTLALLDE